ncbi:MAG: redox-regulated ATPase YchF [Bacteroidales bacterium]
MALQCGIIGLTNSGKTTLFNCMSNTRAESSTSAFNATKSNIGMVRVPDNRLYELAKLQPTRKIVHTTIEFVDIPGLAKGASLGAGVGNKFLADIRNTDALIHVLRCFDDEALPHIDGSVNPVRDMETVDLELQVRDLESVDKKIVKTEKLVKAGDKAAGKTLEVLSVYKQHLESFRSARSVRVDEKDKQHVSDLSLLSAKPVIYICNVDEASAVSGNKFSRQVEQALEGEDAEVLIVAAGVEADIAELENEEDRVDFLNDAGLSEPGVNKLIRAAYRLLDLHTFFTVGPKEIRAWTISGGMTAPQAAGVIHSDMERGFIRAEVIRYNDFIALGSEAACREKGKLSIEGRNYVVKDGDLLNIRFNV